MTWRGDGAWHISPLTWRGSQALVCTSSCSTRLPMHLSTHHMAESRTGGGWAGSRGFPWIDSRVQPKSQNRTADDTAG